MIFSENRFTLFRIMLQAEFPDERISLQNRRRRGRRVAGFKQAVTDRLPDMLRENLRLVFGGTPPPTPPPPRGHYYAHPGNRFWRALHEAGLTSRRYQPSEFRA